MYIYYAYPLWKYDVYTLLKNDMCIGVCASIHVIFDALHGPGHPIRTDFSTFHVMFDALLHQKPRQGARGQTGHPMYTDFFYIILCIFFQIKSNFAKVRRGKLDTQYKQIFLSVLCNISLV